MATGEKHDDGNTARDPALEQQALPLQWGDADESPGRETEEPLQNDRDPHEDDDNLLDDAEAVLEIGEDELELDLELEPGPKPGPEPDETSAPENENPEPQQEEHVDIDESAHPQEVSVLIETTPVTTDQNAEGAEHSPSLGEALVAAREQQNLTVAQAAQQTNIRPDYIHDLEADRFDRLPTGSVYTKAYLKSLCRLYQHDAAPMLAMFAAIASENQPEIADQDASGQPRDALQETITRSGSGDTFSRRLGWIITGLILVIAVILTVRSCNLDDVDDSQVNTEKALTEEIVEELLVPRQLPLTELPVP